MQKKYIDIQEKENCCGCGACVNACKQECISMYIDEEGFEYPKVNNEECINCGECLKKCHMINRIRINNSFEPSCYVAYNKDDKKIEKGSSGGVFQSLYEVIYDMQGIVYGVSLDSGMEIRHHRASNIKDAEKFRKSKYLQSDIGITFLQAKRDLEEGRNVLFSGTPCQIGGLYGYLGKEYSNLYTVDLVCHGVPSKRVFIEYLKVMEKKYNSKPISICWRDKRDGWGPNKISIKFADGREVVTTSSGCLMQTGFLHNLYLRPSCYQCKYAAVPRIADISLGDFWGYDKTLAVENCNKGLSMVVVSNEKGRYLFNKIRKKIFIESVDLDYCKEKSIHLANAPMENRKRYGFMIDLKNGMGFKDLSKKYMFLEETVKECDLFEFGEFIAGVEAKNMKRSFLTNNSTELGNMIWNKVESI